MCILLNLLNIMNNTVRETSEYPSGNWEIVYSMLTDLFGVRLR